MHEDLVLAIYLFFSSMSDNLNFNITLPAMSVICSAMTLLVCAPAPKLISKKAHVTMENETPKDTIIYTAKKPPQDSLFDQPRFIEPHQWPGHHFFVLPKNPLFKKFGYELYDSPRLGNETAPSRSAIALENHRIRSDIVGGRTLKARAVWPQANGEFLVAFTSDIIQDTIWAMTRHGAIEGIALSDDLALAQKKWKGTTIYSRRRFIDSWDSLKGAFTSIPVSIAEPLLVIDAVWGHTPIPPKPIWLIVERADGTRGFIPIHVSWTNVVASLRSGRNAWSDDILSENPRHKWQWEEAVWQAIDRHTITIGMTTEQVRLSWSDPKEYYDSTSHDGSAIAVWVYPAGTTIFINDSLVAVGK